MGDGEFDHASRMYASPSDPIPLSPFDQPAIELLAMSLFFATPSFHLYRRPGAMDVVAV
jgi:hypothetical protein